MRSQRGGVVTPARHLSSLAAGRRARGSDPVRVSLSWRRGHMNSKRGPWRVAAAVLACLALAVSASAQITTGTVAGHGQGRAGRRHSRRDGHARQRNHAARGRRPWSPTPPATSCFPNITPDTYTVEVTMGGFKTLQPQRACRSAAATASPLPAIDDRSGRRDRRRSTSRPRRR